MEHRSNITREINVMAWHSKYIVLRPNSETSALEEVYRCNEMKKANYWVKYIAQPNDVVFTTNLHPKHPGGEHLEYFSHKVSSGNAERDKDAWQSEFGALSLPEGQAEEGP